MRPRPSCSSSCSRPPAPGARTGTVASTDLFYDGRAAEEERWTTAGAVAVDMETAPLFALARLRGLEAASLLLVTDLLAGGRTRIGDDALRAGEHRLGEVAIAALAG